MREEHKSFFVPILLLLLLLLFKIYFGELGILNANLRPQDLDKTEKNIRNFRKLQNTRNALLYI